MRIECSINSELTQISYNCSVRLDKIDKLLTTTVDC
jgi:hypothetical protein